MSHHYSGPEFGFPRGDARLDLTDIYAFPKPGDASKSILIMNVHPSSTVIDPHSTTAEPFAPDAVYELKIDTNGDAVADVAYRVNFVSLSEGRQIASVSRVEGALAAGADDGGEVVVTAAPVSRGSDAQVTEAGDYRFFAGWRSEPFFFDTLGAVADLQFTGADFFADKDICSIVLEVANSTLGSKPIGLWARILDRQGDRWIQVERGARPQQAVFLPGEQREDYLSAEPADDNQFIKTFAHTLEHSGGYGPAEAERVARTLLPDILVYNPSRPASFPENGRSLTDDAADVFMAIFTNGRVPGDGVGPHRDLLAEFPYLGSPHNPHL
ncbi:DUF4331 domain-containing protein [Mesorhizobium sp. CA14]|uniref:DUF4331 family protein n=1 Tax=Mesorhizobium sp. CA14 TaxID=2876642 RepID=UPI001CCBC3D2|nr:DUF4331 family protein [Mesorhizobium sp. CA14]MBZ9847381.1 DUF4331 domain-containing protein [Mesorhizobium sp. CA14]